MSNFIAGYCPATGDISTRLWLDLNSRRLPPPTQLADA
jgi:hypothetical protein